MVISTEDTNHSVKVREPRSHAHTRFPAPFTCAPGWRSEGKQGSSSYSGVTACKTAMLARSTMKNLLCIYFFFFFTKLHKAFRIKHCGCKLQQGKTHGINSTSISGPGGWDASFPMWKPSLTNGWDGPLLTGAADVTQPPSRVLRMIHASMRWRVSNDLYCGEKQETRGQRSAPQGFLIKADI